MSAMLPDADARSTIPLSSFEVKELDGKLVHILPRNPASKIGSARTRSKVFTHYPNSSISSPEADTPILRPRATHSLTPILSANFGFSKNSCGRSRRRRPGILQVHRRWTRWVYLEPCDGVQGTALAALRLLYVQSKAPSLLTSEHDNADS